VAGLYGYATLTACAAVEVIAALNAGPISLALVDEQILAECDLRRVLLFAPVVILSDRTPAAPTHDLATCWKYASSKELAYLLKTMVGPPKYRGSRRFVALRNGAVDRALAPSESA
jgi:hypothetical protein